MGWVADRQWWASPMLWFLLGAVATAPFILADLPPLTDLLNHIASYHIFFNVDHSPFLSKYYEVHWHLIGNMGVDLIVWAIGPFLGAELAARIAVGTIPMLTVAGIYTVSRASNGEVVPSALVALPLAYNWPLNMGFVNFSLSAAMALLIFALWVRLRAWGFFARLLIFAPLSFATWVAHLAGWGLLGLAVLGFELVRAHRLYGFNLRSLFSAAISTLPFALMILFTLLWRSETSSPLGITFLLESDFLTRKLKSLATLFREEYMLWDVGSSLIFFSLLIAFFFAGGRRFVYAAGLAALLLLLAFAICPEKLFLSAFADRRLVPYVAIFVALSVGVSDWALSSERQRRILSLLAVGAIAFFVARISVTTILWERFNHSFEQHLALLEMVPSQSRIFGLVVRPCHEGWPIAARLDHLQQLAVPRRESVINGLFDYSGTTQVDARYRRKLDGLGPNMEAYVFDEACYPNTTLGFQQVIGHFARDHFDYVWLVSPEPLPLFDSSGLNLIGSSNNDRLYQIRSVDEVTISK
jgi:hypothetical protein